jgi:hypothetical protein
MAEPISKAIRMKGTTMESIMAYYRQNRAAAQAVLTAWEQINTMPIDVAAFCEADIPAEVRQRVEDAGDFGRLAKEASADRKLYEQVTEAIVQDADAGTNERLQELFHGTVTPSVPSTIGMHRRKFTPKLPALGRHC